MESAEAIQMPGLPFVSGLLNIFDEKPPTAAKT